MTGRLSAPLGAATTCAALLEGAPRSAQPDPLGEIPRQRDPRAPLAAAAGAAPALARRARAAREAPLGSLKLGVTYD